MQDKFAIRFGILTVSDRSSAGERADLSGPVLEQLVDNQEWDVAVSDIVPDEIEKIKNKLVDWVDNDIVDVILTTGGTGFSPRDVTPEATLAVIERGAPGIMEAVRQASLNITSHAMLSRAAAGIRKNVLIINFPGSPKAVQENFEVVLPVLPHAVKLLHDDSDAESGHRKIN